MRKIVLIKNIKKYTIELGLVIVSYEWTSKMSRLPLYNLKPNGWSHNDLIYNNQYKVIEKIDKNQEK